jgi:chitin disaccharide deacetylase
MDTPMKAEAEAETAELRLKGEPAVPTRGGGILIVNADDWGRNVETTDRTLECVLGGAVSSVSAMVCMEDSERAAAIAREKGVDAGLHLNFTLGFSARGTPPRLIEHQQRLSRYLRMHRFAPVMFHPGLTRSFEYVVAAQRDEFVRLYGTEPVRLDGHHHMHLCSNMLLGGFLAPGALVRRSFSYQRGEKSGLNRFYRRLVDSRLTRRHRVTDFFFSLAPLHPVERLRKIFALARQSAVEVETHPVNPEEHQFLAGGEIFRWTGDVQVAPRFALS